MRPRARRFHASRLGKQAPGAAVKEDLHVRQISGERQRRWFYSDDFDLIVWLNGDGAFAGFELCYDKQQAEHSILWDPAGGFRHMAVDDGESRPGRYKATPMHVAAYVLRALRTHPNWAAATRRG